MSLNTPVAILPIVLTLLLWSPVTANGQDLVELPFAAGERIVYRARVANVGTVGRGAMWIEGPVLLRGVPTLLLRFDMSAGFGPVKASDRTSSWLDATRMASLRFTKRERSPVANHQEEVEVFPEEKIWHSAGASGETASNRPLDELSYIYYIRTLPLEPGAHYRLDRHFDVARNPTTVTVIRRETVLTPAGEFPTILVEMRVRDSRRYKDVGVIRLNLSDDGCRIPVRIASAMRVLGTVVLTLESYQGQGGRCAAPRIAQRNR